MAKVLDGVTLTRQQARSWHKDEWFDGRVWELKRGEDFSKNITNARLTLQSKARKRGKKSRVRKIDNDTIHFQVFNE